MDVILGIFAWPIAVVVLGVIVALIFKKPLRGFIERIRSVGKDGVTTGETPQAQQAQPEINTAEAVDELMRVTDSGLLTELETGIVGYLRQRGLETDTPSIRVLARHLAATQIALEFEQVHNAILGSQIVLLKRLNEHQLVGIDRAAVEEHFARLREQYGTLFEGFTVDSYLSFLFNRVLIRHDNGRYNITVRGTEFLTWMVRMGRSENRAW